MKDKGCAMDIAILRLGHIPYVVTNNRKMAVWSDVKEILLWCPNPHCSVVLNSLKILLEYPASEEAMHPCSQLEQLLFLKQFMFITHGTLLVDLDIVRDAAILTVLYNTVIQKHAKSKDPVILNCTKMLKIITEKYANTSFKIPINSVSSKQFLPAVRRMVKSESATDVASGELTSKQRCLKSCEIPLTEKDPCGALTGTVQTARIGESTDFSSRTLVPLCLLHKLYSGCEEFLDEVVRLYLLDRCREKNLQSICQCTVEEGIQLTRFLASQNGYEMPWLCCTSASLMMSWSEFWIGLERMYGGIVVSMSSGVCVVTLSCQTTEERHERNALPRSKLPTQLSPPLSPITDIAKNVQSHSGNGAIKSMSEESQLAQDLETAYRLYGQTNVPEVENNLVVKLTLSEGPQPTGAPETDDDAIVEVSVTNKDATGTEAPIAGSFEENVGRSSEQIQSNKQCKVGNRDRKHSKKLNTKKLRNKKDNKSIDNKKNRDAGSYHIDSKSELHASMCLKSPELKSRISKKAKIQHKGATAVGSSSRGIKSRLRCNYQDKKFLTQHIDVNKTDENNSAVNKTLQSKIAKTVSGDTNNSERKLVELTDFSSPVLEQVDIVPFPYAVVPVSHGTNMQVELPKNDLGSIAYTKMENIQASITPKKTQGRNNEESLESSQDLFQKLPKKKVKSSHAVRAERKTLKISSAQLNDEIQSNLRYSSKIPVKKKRCSLNAETGIEYLPIKLDEETNQLKDSERQNADTLEISYNSKHKFLAPKQLELTSPMLRSSDPNVIQDSRTISHKPVKNEEKSTKKQAETLKSFLKFKNAFPLLEGGQVYNNSLSQESKSGRMSAGSAKDSPHDSTHGHLLRSDTPNHKKSVLHEKIVNNIQKDAVNTQFSVSRNQYDRENLFAEGQPMKAFNRYTDLPTSEFLEEGIAMWKVQVEQSVQLSPPCRTSKSAVSVQKETVNQQQKSSILSSRTPGFYHICSPIKTALHAAWSKDHAPTDVFDEQNSFDAPQKEAFILSTKKLIKTDNTNNLRNEANNHSLPCAVSADSLTAQTPVDDQYDVQNFGSSSSTTPDIYDVFARKGKQKPLRSETVKIKPKPNFHTVGYISAVKTTDKSNQYSNRNNINQGLKQIYQHKDTFQLQNLPYSSMTNFMNALTPEQFHSGSPSPNSSQDGYYQGSDETQSTELLQTETFGIQSLPTLHYIGRSQERQNPYINVQQDHGKAQKQHSSENIETKNKCSSKDAKYSVAKKMSAYIEHNLTQGKLEYLEYMNSIHSILGTNSRCPSSVKNTDQLESSSSSHFKPDMAKVCAKNNSRILKKCFRSKSAPECTKHSEQEMYLPRATQDVTEKMLSKVNTQLYFKVPDDDKFYPVSENTMIPRHAQFFVQANLAANDEMLPSTSSMPSIKGIQTFHENTNRLKQNLNLLETLKENNETKTKDTRIARNSCEIRETECSRTDISKEEQPSDTTFESIIKASEEFIDKSEHKISETKLVLEKPLEDETDKNLWSQLMEIDTGASKRVVEDNSRCDKVNSPTVIEPFSRLVKKSSQKSFKEVVEENRVRKSLTQQDFSKKNFLKSAYMNKSAQFHSTQDDKPHLQADIFQTDTKVVEFYHINSKHDNDKCIKQLSSNDEAEVKHSGRIINSKFVIASEQCPEFFIARSNGDVTNNAPSDRNRTKNNSHTFNSRAYSDYAVKQCKDSTGNTNIIKYQRTKKPVNICPKSNYSRGHQQEKTDDCTSKLLTALRRLSIEKSPKKVQELLRIEARRHKLKSSMVKHVSETSVKTFVDQSNEHKNNSSESVMKSDASRENNSEKGEEKNNVSTNYTNYNGKIPVVVSIRTDCPKSSGEKESSKNDTDDLEENANEQWETDFVLQQSDIQVPHCEYTQTAGEAVANTNQNTELSGEKFITQYSTREPSLFDTASMTKRCSLNRNAEKEKYLGIPFYQEANSNKNNAKSIFPGLNGKNATDYQLDQSRFQEHITDVSTEQYAEHMDNINNCVFDVNARDGLDHMPAVSKKETDMIRNQNQQLLKLTNQDFHLNVMLDKIDTDHGITNFANCVDNDLLIEEGRVPNVSYVHSSVLGTEYSEMLPGSSFDTKWLKTAFSKNIEDNSDGSFDFTKGDEQESVDVEKRIIQDQDQIHDGRYTYIENDIPKAQSNDRLFETINVISGSHGSNSSEKEDKEINHPIQILAADGSFCHGFETVPVLNPNLHVVANNDDIANFTTSYLCQSDISGTLMYCTDKEIFESTTGTELTDSKACKYTASLINEDWDHYYQINSPCDAFEVQEQPAQTLNFEGGNCSNDSNNCDKFLDETECGQEICIDDKEMCDKISQDIESRICDSYENGIVCDISSTRNIRTEICRSRSNKNDGQHKSNNTEGTDIISKNEKSEKICEKQTNENGIGYSLSKDSCKISVAKVNEITENEKKKQKRSKHKNKQSTNGNTNIDLLPVQGRYSTSECEIEAHLMEINNGAGLNDSNKKSEKRGSPKTASKECCFRALCSDESLPDNQFKLSCKAPCSHNEIQTEISVKDLKVDNHEQKVHTKMTSENDDSKDDDDESDKDYNPEDDINDLETSSESDNESVGEFTSDSLTKSVNANKNEKSENVTKRETYSCKNKYTDRKRHGVYIEKIRKSFQKKYDIKNSSAIHKWKQNSLKKKIEDTHQSALCMNLGQNTCNINEDRKEKSNVREFCSKKKETCNVNVKTVGYEKHHTSGNNRLHDRLIETNNNEKFDVKDRKQDEKTDELESKSMPKCRKKKSKRTNEILTKDEGENSEDEKKSVAAEGFIKTQKLYYEILKKSSLGARKEDIQEYDETRNEEACVDDLSEVIEAVPVHGERVITKALTDAEKALEGTGSLEDIQDDDDDYNDDEGTMIEDLINQCRYQMIEDEDHVQLGGIAYFKDFALPFIYINGYKFTPQKEALTIFTPSCCNSACTIPRSVLQKCRVLVKSLSTWEQVYKLELIKMKKGPPIMTGDMLVKLDTLLVQLPELIEQIVEKHIGTTLKRSKKCNISEYQTLKSKIVKGLNSDGNKVEHKGV